MTKDPYAILGVARNASAADIKAAYRRLAKRLHPDISPGNDAHEQRFKEVASAYDLLSDPQKRARFDRGEIDAVGAERGWGSRPGGTGRRGPDSNGGVSLDEILAEVLGRRRRDSHAAGERAGNATETLRLGFIEAALGGKRVIALGDGRKVEITVPSGVESGQRLRLRHGPLQETYLEIEVEAHPLFRRDGRDVHVDLPVTLPEAVLGAVVTVPTIHGDVALKVPPGSNSGATLRLRAKGIPAPQGHGDQYVKLRVVLPDPPDPELVAFLEHWGARHPYQVRGKRRNG
jgi:DnaJ-class molecular chaperone